MVSDVDDDVEAQTAMDGDRFVYRCIEQGDEGFQVLDPRAGPQGSSEEAEWIVREILDGVAVPL